MIVTIFRHGQAGDGTPDRARELTGTGEDDVGFGAHRLHEACDDRQLPAPDLILHSPWVRTTQTAEILAGAFTHADVQSSTALQPGSNTSHVDAALDDLQVNGPTPQHALLVSHQPLVSMLVDHYTGQPGSVPGLSPGGLAALELEAAGAGCARTLFWALPPEYEAGL